MHEHASNNLLCADARRTVGMRCLALPLGNAVTELGAMVHFGANDTDEPIVILASLLTESAEDLAVVVTTVP